MKSVVWCGVVQDMKSEVSGMVWCGTGHEE